MPNISETTDLTAIQFKEAAAPTIPASGFGRLWVDTSGMLNFTNDAGITIQLVTVTGGAQVTAGSYAGNSTDNRNITGVGFTPKTVLLQANTIYQAFWKPSSLAGDATLSLSSGYITANYIQALNSDGFQVGTDARVNATGSIYYYVAIG